MAVGGAGIDIGLIGFGAIGQRIHAVLRKRGGPARVAAVLLREGSASRAAAEAAGLPVFVQPAAFVAASPGIVVECAGQPALAEHAPAVLAHGRDLIVASIGALADPAVEAALRDGAAKGGGRVHLPAGAVGGIDALAAMRLAGLHRVVYRSRKPPAAWKGSPAERCLDLDGLREAAVFYRGSAREAARDYPKNANVAATVALAGLGFDRTDVQLAADPGVSENIHEVEAEGPSGRIAIRLEGRPDPDNPKTSALTALSLARAVLNLTGAWRI